MSALGLNWGFFVFNVVVMAMWASTGSASFAILHAVFAAVHMTIIQRSNLRRRKKNARN